MKRLIFSVAFFFFAFAGKSQLTTKVKCPDFYVDILDGKVSGIKANAADYDIKKILPCFTSAEPDNSSVKCGGGVFYKDKDISFYTDRDYIQIGPKFKGKLSLALIGAKRNSFFKVLGNPKMSDDTWDAFVMQYGLLILRYDKAGKVNLIQISTKGLDNISLCE